MKAYDMSRFQRVIGTDGRISGTWIALQSRSERDIHIKPSDVTIYDETHSYGRVLGRDDLLAFVRDGEIDVPKHMISERIRPEVEEVWEELIELLALIAQAFIDGPRELVPTLQDSENEEVAP